MSTPAERLRSLAQTNLDEHLSEVPPRRQESTAAGSTPAERLRALAGQTTGWKGLRGTLANAGRQFVAGASDVVPYWQTDDPEPSTLTGSAARFAGQTAAIAPVLGVAAMTVPAAAPAVAGAGLLTRAGKGAKNLLHGYGKAFRSGKGVGATKITAAETALGASAGAGGHLASQVFPDSDAAKISGELLGGLAPTLLPFRIAVGTAHRIRNNFKNYRIVGARRASDRLKRAIPPKARPKVFEHLDEPVTPKPATLEQIGSGNVFAEKPVLTLAQRSDDEGLMALDKAMRAADETLLRESNTQIAEANTVIQEASRRVVTGAEDIDTFSTTSQIVEDNKRYLSGLLDTWLQQTALKAEKRIEALGTGVTADQANNIMIQELETAYEVANKQKDELFEMVPTGTLVGLKNVTEELKLIQEKVTGSSTKIHIPSRAISKLDPKSKEFIGVFGGETSVFEIRDLQKELNQIKRRAFSSGLDIRGGIAARLSDAIDEDLASNFGGKDVTEALTTAVDFSREVKSRFTRGTVGKVLKLGPGGEYKLPVDVALKRSIGLSEEFGRVAYDDIIKAFELPVPASLTGGDAGVGATKVIMPDGTAATQAEFDLAPHGVSVVKQAAEDYMKAKFLERATVRGTDNINTTRAIAFMERHQHLLQRMPQLKTAFDEAIDAQDLVTLRNNMAENFKRNYNNPTKAKSALLLKRGPVETLRQISEMEVKKAGKEAKKLMFIMNKDKTGESAKGLKAAFVEFIINAGKENNFDTEGGALLSGRAMKDLLKKRQVEAMSYRILGPKEQSRLASVVRDLAKLEKYNKVPLPAEGVIQAKPSVLAGTISRFFGAGVGRKISETTGTGGSIQQSGATANLMYRMVAKFVKNPAERLIEDAVQDRDLLAALLSSPDAAGKTADRHWIKLRAWAVNVLAENGHVYDFEDTIEQQEEAQLSLPRRPKTRLESVPETEGVPRGR